MEVIVYFQLPFYSFHFFCQVQNILDTKYCIKKHKGKKKRNKPKKKGSIFLSHTIRYRFVARAHILGPKNPFCVIN